MWSVRLPPGTPESHIKMSVGILVPLVSVHFLLGHLGKQDLKTRSNGVPAPHMEHSDFDVVFIRLQFACLSVKRNSLNEGNDAGSNQSQNPQLQLSL